MQRQADLPSGYRVLTAFLVAPLLPILAYVAFAGSGDLRLFPLALVIGGYVPALLVGLPVFAVARRRLKVSPLNCALAGAFVAALPWTLLLFAPLAGEASIDGGDTIIDGRLTWFGVTENLHFLAPIVVLGALGGGIFWLIVGRPHTEARRPT